MPDNNTRKSRHLTPEERIALQAEEIKQLQQKIAQLRAQVTQMREALTVANSYMPDIGHFCTCGKCKTCGTDINYAGYGHCLKCARGIIDAALSDTPLEQLEQQTVDLIAEDDTIEAMRKHIEALQQENEQLQAQVARMREALECVESDFIDGVGIVACAFCGKESAKERGHQEFCVVGKALISIDTTDYHNPADVEALIMAMEAIKAAWSDGSANAAMDKASGALAAIDKVIGGKEDE